MKKIILTVLVVGLFLGLSSTSYAQVGGCIGGNPFSDIFCTIFRPGQATSGNELLNIVRSIGGYLIVFAGIIAGIVIVAAGLMYMAAGSNPTKVANAKTTFKNGLIGALIVFAVGIIISTIVLLGTDWKKFFS